MPTITDAFHVSIVAGRPRPFGAFAVRLTMAPGVGGSPKEEELATVTARRNAQWWKPTWLITLVRSYAQGWDDIKPIRKFRV